MICPDAPLSSTHPSSFSPTPHPLPSAWRVICRVLWVGLTNHSTLAAKMLFEMGKLLANCSISGSSNKYSLSLNEDEIAGHKLICLPPLFCSGITLQDR